MATVRTISVKLEAEIAGYVADMRAAGMATDDITGHLSNLTSRAPGVGKSFDAMGKSVAEFERIVTSNLRDGETAFESLTRRSGELRTEIGKLTADFKKTADIGVLGNLKTAKSDLSSVESVLKDMSQVGEKAGSSFASNFSKSVSSLFSGQFVEAVSNPVGAGIAAGIVAVALPVIGAGIAAAVSGGVGLGLIAAAALVHKDDPLLQSAFKDLTSNISTIVRDATAPLADEFVTALDKLDAGASAAAPKLAALFAPLASTIGPITDDAGHLASVLLPALTKDAQVFADTIKDPGVQHSIHSAEDAFAGLFQTVGDNPQLVADGFKLISWAVGATANTLSDLVSLAAQLDSFAKSIGATIGQINGSSELFDSADKSQQTLINLYKQGSITTQQAAAAQAEFKSELASGTITQGEYSKRMQELAAIISLFGGVTAPQATTSTFNLAQAQAEAAQSAAAASSYYTGLIGTLQQTANTADTVAGAMSDKLLNSLMSSDQATLGWHQSLTNLSTAFDKVGKGAITAKGAFDLTRASGQNLESAVLASVQAAQKSYDTNIALGMSADDAAKAYDGQFASLQHVHGLTKTQQGAVDDLIGKYKKVPSKVNSTIVMQGLTAAVNNLDTTLRLLNGLDGFTANATVTTHFKTIGTASPLQAHPRRWGGVTEHAATGLVNAGVYSPASPARYAFAEPQTGGEAFVPRRGDYGRSMSILSHAASWYGANVVPGGGASTGGGSYSFNFSGPVGSRTELENWLTGAISSLQRKGRI